MVAARDATHPRVAGLPGPVDAGRHHRRRGGIVEARAVDNEPPGPGSANPGYSALLNQPVAAFGGRTYYPLLGVNDLTPGQEPPTGTMPGGCATGALLLNGRWIRPGSVDTTAYNHYSPLRSYEDLLGVTRGGSDGEGHLGMAGMPGLAPFGSDVFNSIARRAASPSRRRARPP